MKFSEWIVVLVVMTMFLSFVGIPTGVSTILSDYGVNITSSQLVDADIGNSGFFNYLFGSGAGILIVLISSTAGAVIIGLFAKSYDTSLVILPVIVTTTGAFIAIFWSTIQYIMAFNQWWITSLVSIIFIGMGVAFIWSAVDYFAGR